MKKHLVSISCISNSAEKKSFRTILSPRNCANFHPKNYRKFFSPEVWTQFNAPKMPKKPQL
jgi:hypothetical protein